MKRDEKHTLTIIGVSKEEMSAALRGMEWEHDWISNAVMIDGTDLYEVKLSILDMDQLSKVVNALRCDKVQIERGWY